MRSKVIIIQKINNVGYDVRGKQYSIPEIAKEMVTPFYAIVDDVVVKRHTIELDEGVEHTFETSTIVEAFQNKEELLNKEALASF